MRLNLILSIKDRNSGLLFCKYIAKTIVTCYIEKNTVENQSRCGEIIFRRREKSDDEMGRRKVQMFLGQSQE